MRVRQRGNAAAVAADPPAESSPWPQPPRDLELSFVWIDGEELAVLSHPVDEPLPLKGLTEAEHQVAKDILDGLSNPQIALRRGTVPRTVAKQVASIFRKLGVGSRRQLAATHNGGARGDLTAKPRRTPRAAASSRRSRRGIAG
jgi:DNA-binding CsgD family transcriptional regulator